MNAEMSFKRTLLAVGLALLLGLMPLAACAESAAIEPYLGTWQADNILLEVRVKGDELQCRAMRVVDVDERDLLEYGGCWYDEKEQYLQCMGYTRSHEIYSELSESWEETDWALSDLYFAELKLSEDGQSLTWTDENIEGPILLTRREDGTLDDFYTNWNENIGKGFAPSQTDEENTEENSNFFEQGIQELNLDDLDQVTGGKKRPFVRSLGRNVNVRKGPGTEYAVVAQLGYLDEVAVTGATLVRDAQGYYWAKVNVAVSQTGYVEGWVCSKYCEGCWH